MTNHKRNLPGLTFIKRKNPPLNEVLASLRELESQLPKEKRGGVSRAIKELSNEWISKKIIFRSLATRRYRLHLQIAFLEKTK